MNKTEIKERMNVWEQLWYFFLKYSKNIKSVKITHLLAIAGCSGIFVSLQSRVAFRVAHFVLTFKTC